MLSFEAMANNNIPESLFGDTLGKIIKDLDEKSLNVKKITGCNKGFPITRCYFQPIDQATSKLSNQTFPYIEYNSDNSKYYSTSFYVEVLSVFPEELIINSIDIKTKESLYKIAQHCIVCEIGWLVSEDSFKFADKNNNPYSYVTDLCKVFEEALGMESKVLDDGKLLYACRFRFGDKRFDLAGFDDNVLVILKYKDEILDKKPKEAEEIFNNIKSK